MNVQIVHLTYQLRDGRRSRALCGAPVLTDHQGRGHGAIWSVNDDAED